MHPDTIPTSFPGRRSVRWGKRNQEVAEWIRLHPSTIASVLPWFRDLPKPGETEREEELREKHAFRRAYHAVNKLYEQGRIKYQWSIRVNAEGRPVHVYCGWACKMDTLKSHELPLTYFCRAYKDFEWVRGTSAIQRIYKETEPDAVMIGDKTRFVEYDSALEREGTYKEHMTRYKGTNTRILIVVPWFRDDRIEQLIGWGESVNHLAAYTTLDRVMATPYGQIWRDSTGKVSGLTKPSGKPSNKPGEKL